MMSAPTDDTEELRLEKLQKLDILDTPRELAFDRITGLVRKIFGVPMSTVTFIDGHRQWFKSCPGMKDRETDRKPALCYHAIREISPFVVEDTRLNPIFQDNPFVTGSPFIRAYAGVQLKYEGVNIGTLCAMDTVPRGFSAEDIDILADLAAIVMDELAMRTAALRDHLTGALSRRAFRSEADRLIALARRHGHIASCAMLDFDHFKRVNDTYGHGTGDVVLKAVVDVCRRTLRKSDIIGRIGGEEFAVLLPHTELASAREAIEKVRKAIAETVIATPAGSLNVTCSFGLASTDGTEQDLDQLLRCADSALYAAKEAGRNQTIVWVAAPPLNGITMRKVLKAGRIAFNIGRSTIDCTVRSLSEKHAIIDVVNAAGVPEKFKLQIGANDISRACQIVSKSESRIEVEFT
jgi:diguanylate cyclase (GGDEF)-like protein